MTVAALIVAAGRGTRTGGLPKQYRMLGRGSVLARSVDVFQRHPGIGSITVVIHPDDAEHYHASLEPVAKLAPPVTGAATRQGSVRAGLEALSDIAPSHVLIHDAARPFLDAALIDRVLAGLTEAPGAVPGLLVTDTLKRATDDRVISGTVERAGLWHVQTPQGFAYAAILAAHRRAAADGRSDFTDDAAVMEWAGSAVKLVPGDAANAKLTTAEDLTMAEYRITADVRTGSGFDVHRFCDGDHVMLCGARVPHTHALEGHSDADVALHALTDALLGAIGDGDIGQHFPPSDQRWHGADSAIFLIEAARRVAARGGIVAHVDITIVCEAPRIGPHRDAMRARLASLLGIDPSRTSVKATTSEQLGFTGRREGIAAMATATVRLPIT